jgi:hypothetical protein
MTFFSALVASHAMAADKVKWPDLSGIKVVTGRAATEADVNAGHAVFVLKSGATPIGRPLSIPLPQYAYHLDPEAKTQTPCVLIQAEEANGQKLGGCRNITNGSLLAGYISEFKLLGQRKP